MPWPRSAWTTLYRRDKAAAFREIEELLELYDGNISRTAHALGFVRRSLYDIIERDGDTLWPIVDRIRAAALERIEARRRLLTGDSPWPSPTASPRS